MQKQKEMIDNHNNLQKGPKELIDDYDYLQNAASAGDCTGLIPSLPTSDAELESYNEVYQYQPPYSHSVAGNSKKKTQ